MSALSKLLVLTGLLLLPGRVDAQNTGVNPVVGSVWTYLGPTYGAGWLMPPDIGSAVNYIPLSGPFAPNPDLTQATVVGVMGSAAAPDATINFPAVFQKIGADQVGPQGGAILGTLIDRNPNTFGAWHGSTIQGIAETAIPYAPGQNSFFEGVRGQCNVLAGSTNVECTGMAAEVNFPVGVAIAIAVEGAVNNTTGSRESTLSVFHDVAFLASCGDHGGTPNGCGAAFLINNNNAAPFLCGLCIIGGITQIDVTQGVDIYFANNTQTGIDMHLAQFAKAIILPNENKGGDVWAQNAAGTAQIMVIGLSGLDQVLVGTAATGGVAIGKTGTETDIEGSLNVHGNYLQNGTPAVSCTGTPSSSFAALNGIVTHC